VLLTLRTWPTSSYRGGDGRIETDPCEGRPTSAWSGTGNVDVTSKLLPGGFADHPRRRRHFVDAAVPVSAKSTSRPLGQVQADFVQAEGGVS
jgi:hypothetical protein